MLSGAESVLNLFWDLAPPKWSTLSSVMLKAYFDESAADGIVFVVGGFVASPKQWLKFSGEWQKVLDMPRPLAYFKFEEALGFRGEFAHMSEELRNERLNLFYDVIVENVQAAVLFAIHTEPFNRVFKQNKLVGWPYNKIYFHAVMNLIQAMSDHRIDLGINQPVQFIFDDGLPEKAVITGMWDLALKDKEWAELMNTYSIPYFLDDKIYSPIQAADFMAGYGRLKFEQKLTGKREAILPFLRQKGKKDIRVFHTEWDEFDMWEFIKDRNKSQGRFVTYQYGNKRGIG